MVSPLTCVQISLLLQKRCGQICPGPSRQVVWAAVETSGWFSRPPASTPNPHASTFSVLGLVLAALVLCENMETKQIHQGSAFWSGVSPPCVYKHMKMFIWRQHKASTVTSHPKEQLISHTILFCGDGSYCVDVSMPVSRNPGSVYTFSETCIEAFIISVNDVISDVWSVAGSGRGSSIGARWKQSGWIGVKQTETRDRQEVTFHPNTQKNIGRV